MKKITILLFLVIGTTLSAQVGIGTTDPKGLLDIAVGNPNAPAPNDGIIVPKLNALPATDPGSDQHGMLIYLTTDGSGYFEGFHYWDNNITDWVPLRNEWTRAVNSENEAYIRSNIAYENGFQINFGENGDFGIGTNNPVEHIELRRAGDNDMQFTSANTNPPNLIFYNTGGSLDAPGLTGANQEIGSMIFKTHDGNGIQEIGGLRMYMDGTPTNGSTPSKFVISTTPSGTTNQAEVVTIDNQGYMGIGVTDPQAKLDVAGSVKIVDGNQGNGKVLTSDANGNATWQTPASSGSNSGWGLSGNNTTSSNFLGTTNYQSLFFRVNNTQVTKYHPNGGLAIGLGASANDSNSIAIGKNASSSSNNDAVAVGYGATGSGYQSTAMGRSSTASNNNTLAVGFQASATGFQSTSLGKGSNSSQNNTLAVGVDSYASAENASSIGYNTDATASNATAVGSGSQASGSASLALGQNAISNSTRGIAAGYSAEAVSDNTIAIGTDAYSNRTNGIAIGYSSDAQGDYSIAVGRDSYTNSTNALAVGRQSDAQGQRSIALGYDTYTNQTSAVAIGDNSESTGTEAVAIGKSSRATQSNATAIGPNAIANQANTVILGNNANVGIGTSAPQAKLHIAGSMRLADGTQGAGKVLKSDANGTASWQTAGVASNFRNGIQYSYSGNFNFNNSLFNSITGSTYNTGSYALTLPEGVYEIESYIAITSTDYVTWNLRVSGSISSQSIGGTSVASSYTGNVTPSHQTGIVQIPSGGASIDFIVTGLSSYSLTWDANQSWLKIKKLQ